ncbi:MAG: hypothetical protein GW778_02705 [Alphaproteobacteria bacterium]|nr:hypothetical protein [Alphaproteobacteria bacterium]
MKKILMLSVFAMAFGAMPALADHHGDKGDRGDRGAKMFEKHDTNGDGAISKDEFISHATDRFSEMDTDGDNKITKEEAKAAHEKRRAEMKERFQERKEKRDDVKKD